MYKRILIGEGRIDLCATIDFLLKRAITVASRLNALL